MKRILGLVLAVSLFALGCEDITGGGGGGGGGTTTSFTKGYVFVRDDKNVYAVDSKDLTAAPLQLTSTGNNRHPSISKDGKSVVFVNTSGATTTIQTIGIASGQTPKTVFTSDATNKNFKNPVFSPDGTKIAFNLEKGSVTYVGLVNVDGSGFATLTPISASYGAPAFIDDTSIIAASGATSSSLTSIQKVTTSGQTSSIRSALGNEATAVVNRVVVSPDGTLAAFDGRIASGVSRIFVMPIAGGVGGNVTQLTDHPGEQTAQDTFPTFVSSNELAFSSNFGGADQVYTVNPNATTKSGGTLTVPSAAEPWFGPN